jgi:hypothetical protein
VVSLRAADGVPVSIEVRCPACGAVRALDGGESARWARTTIEPRASAGPRRR